MLSLKSLTVLWLFFGACQATNDGGGRTPAPKGGVRCFDCDYDYTEGVGLTLRGSQEDSSQVEGKSRGFRQCAFIRRGDQSYVSDTQCSSGTCFIRKDSNGLVYRGCADPANLPIHVNISVNCQPQGPDASVWWFCRGTLCNSGAFGSGDICWVPGKVPVEVKPLPAPSASNATGSSSETRKTVIGKLSKETFEQIQARAGFGNLRPVEYGGSGLNSEQTARYFGNRSATVERGRGNFHSKGGQNLPSIVSTSVETQKNPSSSNSNSSKVYSSSSSSSFFHSNRPSSNNFPVPVPTKSNDAAHSGQESSVQKSSSWQLPVAPVPSPNWPKSWSSGQSQYSSVAQQATYRVDSRFPEPQMPIPAYKTWNPELENGRGVSSGSDQQQRIELKPERVEVDVSASNGNAGYWNNVWSQSQSSGNHAGSSGNAEAAWVFPAFQPSGPSSNGQQQQRQQGASAEGRPSGFDTEIQFIYSSSYNPCDGVCADNPSGLYNHPDASNWFVQCGPGFDRGIACQCCRPHYQQCPQGTFFNSATRVCDEGSNVDFNAIDWQPFVDRRPVIVPQEKFESSVTGDHSSYFRAEGQNAANSGRVQSWSSNVDVSPQPYKPEAPLSVAKSLVPIPQSSQVDKSSKNVDDSSASSTKVQSESGISFIGVIPPLVVPDGLGSKQQQQQQQQQQQRESEERRMAASEADLQFIYSSNYNPCDGVCADNPSGLYNHPSAPNWFVQCGPSFDGGVACQCCRPHYHQCPSGTFFSSATKVCDAGSNSDSIPTADQQLTNQKQDTWKSEESGSSGKTGYWNYVQQHQTASGKQNGVGGAREGYWIRVETIQTPQNAPNPEVPINGGKSWLPRVVQGPIENIGLSLTHEETETRDGSWGTGGKSLQQPIPSSPQASASSGTFKQQLGDITGSDAEIQFIYSSSYNPCDGVCADNPSGLYNHPTAPNWFVQCGPSFDGGVACQCCRPHYHQCPRGTLFSSATKVCEEGRSA